MTAERILAGSGIYAIRNRFNGKVYVGSSINIKLRLSRHKYKLRANKHHSATLQRSWNKYGERCFEFVILELVADADRLIEKEQSWIDRYNSTGETGYNACPIAGRTTGFKQSAELIARRAASNTGKTRTAEQRKAMSDAVKGIRRRPLSDEHKAKLAEAGRRRKLTEAEKKKVSDALSGKCSPKKLAVLLARNALAAGKPLAAEHRARISQSQKGKVLSNETRAKIAAARLRYWEQRRNDTRQADLFNELQ